MLERFLWWRKKMSPQERAAEIIAKYHTKQSRKGEIFTKREEEKRIALGLHPTLRPESHSVSEVEAKDPLTERQRAFLDELGLNPKQKGN